MSRPIPPGLTCARCCEPFGRYLARRTREGWVHLGTTCPHLTVESPRALVEGAGRWVVRGGISRWVGA